MKNEEIRENTAREEKKSYTRPELVKHGNVEALTQWKWYNNPSGPTQ